MFVDVRSLQHALIAAMTLAVLAGCGPERSGSVPEGSPDGSASDGGNDSDSGQDPDSGSEGDAGSDAGLDSDAGTDADGGTGSDAGVEVTGASKATCVPEPCAPGITPSSINAGACVVGPQANNIVGLGAINDGTEEECRFYGYYR